MENLQSKLREYLEGEETLLWVGRPKQGIIFKTSDIFLIPFSIFWLGFAVFWVIGASNSGGILFGLFGVPFVLAGIMFVFGRFIMDAKQRANTTYGLTENRVIIQSGIFSKNAKSLNLHLQREVTLLEHKNGYGTISFGGNELVKNINQSVNWWPGIEIGSSIDLVLDAKKVYSQIVKLQNNGKR